jgi:hypothetical protein
MIKVSVRKLLLGAAAVTFVLLLFGKIRSMETAEPPFMEKPVAQVREVPRAERWRAQLHRWADEKQKSQGIHGPTTDGLVERPSATTNGTSSSPLAVELDH